MHQLADDGVGHAAGAVPRVVEVCQLRHVVRVPLGAEHGDAVSRVDAGLELRDHVLEEWVALRSPGAGRGRAVHDQRRAVGE